MSGATYCSRCGKPSSPGGSFCSGCGSAIESARSEDRVYPAVGAAAIMAVPRPDADEHLLQRIADYERISGILWMILGILQVLMVVTIIVGIWNIFAASSRMKLRPMIMARDARIPAAYEDVTQLVIIGVLNLFLGGVIGVLFVVFDFIIRDMVLSNRRIFNNTNTGLEG